MVDYHELRKKYPKWAHRRDYHAKKRRRSRSRKRRLRRRARRKVAKSGDVTNMMLMSLLHQIMGSNIMPVARKHGENVVSGYAGYVTPEALAPVRARDKFRLERAIADRRGGPRAGAGVGVGAAAHAGGRAPMPS